MTPVASRIFMLDNVGVLELDNTMQWTDMLVGAHSNRSLKRIDSPAVYMGGGWARAPPRDGSGGSELGTAGTSWSIVPLMGEKKKRQDEATGSTMLKLFVRFLFNTVCGVKRNLAAVSLLC